MDCAIFALLLVSLAFSQARVVTVPAGPLIRVEGQTVSIRCDVSDYEGPREQDFEWKLLQNGNSLGLVSTFDSSFPHSSFKDRVNSGALTIVRLGDSEVELRLKGVTAADNGIYQCSTPSTDSSVVGNYDAEVELKVIENRLKVVPVAAPGVVLEGNPLELLCNATRDPVTSTYLSVTWSIRKGSLSPQEILTFGPDGQVTADAGSALRYANKGLQLDMRRSGTYGLILTEVLPSDQGTYTCTAREWALDGGRVWQKILETTVVLGDVKVVPIGQNLKVSVENKTTVDVGSTVPLTCTVSADNLRSLALEITWLVSPTAGGSSNATLAQMSHDGLVVNASDLTGLSQVSLGVFRLLLHNVDQSSSGLYSCRVRAWVRQSSGVWYQAAEKTSEPAKVEVTLIAPEFAVNLGDLVVPQFSGNPMELECRVVNISHLKEGRLGVSWMYTKVTPADLPTSTQVIGTLDQHGDLMPGSAYQQRIEKGLIVLSKVKPDAFKLRFLQMRDTDMGSYSCNVSTWTHTQDGAWLKAKEVHSSDRTIRWTPKNPTLSVNAKSVRVADSSGSTFEMSCQVTGENLQEPGYSILIRKETASGEITKQIVSLSQDSVLKLERQDEPDGVMLDKTGPGQFRFRLYGAQISDNGLYFCDATAWTRDAGNSWVKAVSAESNRIPVAFTVSGPSFNISVRLDSTPIYRGETATVECVLTAQGVSSSLGRCF
ncbi:prostaglandin F2 receptor negative regulator-like [Scleropages formosus]|uniref:Prostaglandin F2 receptor negative regulator-like n=1 Tax=Scleropages formosus TaxID=113540 RepID=A0A0P7UNN9_SCLFO|nr:prostaglandin F2 receptor negative regulator-like [Scleropages formosus]